MLKCCDLNGESMKDLATIRIQHSMLSGVYVQLKNYLDCADRDYLGDLNKEQDLIEELRHAAKSIEKMLRSYVHKEEKILNGE